MHGITIDLALYEAVNAVWKEYKLLGRIDEDTALKYIDILSKIFNALHVEYLREQWSKIF